MKFQDLLPHQLMDILGGTDDPACYPTDPDGDGSGTDWPWGGGTGPYNPFPPTLPYGS